MFDILRFKDFLSSNNKREETMKKLILLSVIISFLILPAKTSFSGVITEPSANFTAKSLNIISLSTKYPANLYPLLGVWEFSYTISGTVFLRNYALDYVVENEKFKGEFMVTGKDESGEPVVAYYDDKSDVFSLIDRNPGESFDSYYVFDISGDKATGSYHRVKPSTLDPLSSVPFSGTKTENFPAPPPDGDDENCPASQLLNNDPEALHLLRQFRDNILMQTETGREITNLYYKYGHSISSSLNNNPRLKDQCRTVLYTFTNLMAKHPLR